MDLAVEYDNRARVREHPEIIARWAYEAERFRATAGGEFDLEYGARPRNRVDVFQSAATSAGPLVIFIHGGYWRSFDKSSFSHMAAGALAHGLPVAVPSYSLCPDATIPDIIAELRQCCLFLWNRIGRPLVVTGHSAGGHLAACLAATRWENYGAPPDLIRAGLSASGIFDLRPLMATPLNADLCLDAVSAVLSSPILWPMQAKCPFDIWVGGEESCEFLRQSRSLASAWTGLGLAAPYVELAGANHFSIVNEFADPRSRLCVRLSELARN